MTIQAAIPLAIPIVLLAERADDGAALVAPKVIVGPPDSAEGLAALAGCCDVITFDHELVPVERLEYLERAGHRLAPSAATMALAQNKRLQREVFSAAGLPVPPFTMIDEVDELTAFGREHGWPLVLKAARGGYDGRGVWIAPDADHGERLAAKLLASGVELMAEQWVSIERELAILVARRPNGETATYPLVETVQVDGMCREIVAPAAVSIAIAAEAQEIAKSIAERSGVVGVLAVELFVVGGKVLINEMAARPHNSGHYTIDGCVTSQFEQHLRAILDWPLGSTALTAPAVVTVNVIGDASGADPASRLAGALAVEGAHVHFYGKGPRAGRKLGHVTVCGDDLAEVRERANRAVAALGGVV